MQTPPGTKVLLIHKVDIQRGFLLLDKNSLKILGGNVEHLVQKWNLTKVCVYTCHKHTTNYTVYKIFSVDTQIVPDSIGRHAACTNDAPQFTPFGAAKPAG